MRAAIGGIAAQGPLPVASENPAPDALPDPYSAPEPVQPKPDPVAFIDAVFDYPMQVMGAMAEPPAPEQPEPSMPLERIVEREFERVADSAGLAPPADMIEPDVPMDPFGPTGPELIPPGPEPM